MQKRFAYKKIIDHFGSKQIKHYVLKYTCYAFVCIGAILSITNAWQEDLFHPEEEILSSNYHSFASASIEDSTVVKQLYLTDPPYSLDRIDPVATGDITTVTSPIIEDQLSVIQVATPSMYWQLPFNWPYPNFGVNYDAGSTGEDRILIVGISFVNDRGSEDVLSVTYGGVPMNREIGEYIANRGYTAIYSLVNPPMGAHQIFVEWNNTIEKGGIIGAVVFEGVDQTAPIAATAANEETGPNPFVTIPSTSDQVVVGVGTGSPDSVYNIANTGEELWNGFINPGEISGVAQYQRGGVEDSIQWASNLSPFSVVAVALQPIDVMEEITFTQTPTMCSGFIVDQEIISIKTKIEIVSGSMPNNPNITAELFVDSNSIITLVNPTYNSFTKEIDWTGIPNTTAVVPAGSSIELRITCLQPEVTFQILYDSQTNPSVINIPTKTYIDILDFDIYDAPYPGGTIIAEPDLNSTVYLRSNVSDPFGAYDITALDIYIGGDLYSATAVDSLNCNKTFEYIWNTPSDPNAFHIMATAKEGFENRVTDDSTKFVIVCDVKGAQPVFDLGTRSERCVGASSMNYHATSNGTNIISYSLDSLSLVAGNTIDPLTGTITFDQDWVNSSIVTASISECGTILTTDHLIVTYSSAGMPIFDLGSTSTRCEGIDTLIYTATAINTDSVLYEIDSGSLAAGVTIDSLTGAVGFIEGWSSPVTITATAFKCGFASKSNHIVINDPSVETPIFDLGPNSNYCQGFGTAMYNATAINSIEITYRLDENSVAAGNIIDTLTGEVFFEQDWIGTSFITASATGCNGPLDAIHEINITENGIATFEEGDSTTRISAFETITYKAISNSGAPVTYSLDPLSLSLGVTIDSTSGEVVYPEEWIGTTYIFASTDGCNGVQTKIHTVVTNTSIVYKQLYFTDPNRGLDRLDPVGTSDGTTANSPTIQIQYSEIKEGTSPVIYSIPETWPWTNFGVNYNTGEFGADQLLLVGISYRNNAGTEEIQYVTYGGIPMTREVGLANTNEGYVAIYSLVNPPSGDNYLFTQWNTVIGNGGMIGAVVFEGVDQITPIAGSSSNQGISTNPSVTISAQEEQLVVGMISGTPDSTYAITNPGMQIWSELPISGELAASAQFLNGLPTSTVEWVSDSASFAAAAVALRPSEILKEISFEQTPAMCTDFVIDQELISIESYLYLISDSFPFNPNISAELSFDSTEIIRFNNPIFDAVSGLLTWSGVPDSIITVPSGSSIDLKIISNEPELSYQLLYDSELYPSRINFPALTYIDVLSFDMYDAPYPGGNIIENPNPNTTVYLRTLVDDPFGADDITALNIDISGLLLPANIVATSGCTKTFEFEWTTPSVNGNYNVTAIAKEGFENKVTDDSTMIITICQDTEPELVFNLGETSYRNSALDSIVYNVVSDNGATVLYSLDSVSLAAGLIINSGTGMVLFPESWTGQSSITATTTDCSGIQESVHVVTTISSNVYKQLYLSNGQSLDRIHPVATNDSSTEKVEISNLEPQNQQVLDRFSNISFLGNNGSKDYLNAWQQIGENDGPENGVLQVVASGNCPDGNCLRFGGFNVDLNGNGANRAADLTNASLAYLNFNYFRTGVGGNNATVNVDISNDGGVTWVTLKTYALNIFDSGVISESIDVFNYISANTQIRFVGSGTTSLLSSWMYIDDIELEYEAIEGTATIDFIQSPTLCDDLEIVENDLLTVSTYINLLEGTMPANPNITATLSYDSTTILTFLNPVYDAGSGIITWQDSLMVNQTIPAGNAIELSIITAEPSVRFEIEYDSETKPSKIELPVSTFIKITDYEIYDAPYPTGTIVSNPTVGSILYPRVVVTDPFGYHDITGLDISILDNSIAASTVDSTDCSKTYEYIWNTPDSIGTYTISATAKEGFENTVTYTEDLQVELCSPPVELPEFVLGETSIRCQGIDTITYSATSTNSTSLLYRLDSLSILAGNHIDSISGEVIFTNNWNDTTIVTTAAFGCGGPIYKNHIVINTPSVGTPIFNLGSTSFRCDSAATIYLNATASNSIDIIYNLDSLSILAGHSINTLTGEASFIAGSLESSIITATAFGCDATTTSIHTVSVERPVETPEFVLGLSSTRCQKSDTLVFTANAENASAINYFLDEISTDAGNSIDSITGEVIFAGDWFGTSIITAVAEGCFGPTVETHTVTTEPIELINFDLGSSSSRTAAAQTVIYNASSISGVTILYTLDSISLAAGNTIVDSTGAVTFVPSWIGVSNITASSTGCNGIQIENHIVNTSNVIKQLYLTDPTFSLDRVDPLATGDSITAQSEILGPGSSAISIVSNPGYGNAGQTASSFLGFYNSGNIGTNRMLLVGVSFRNDDANEIITSVTYGGEPMTEVFSDFRNNDGYVYIFRLLDPPTGENELEILWNNPLDWGAVIGAVTFDGVNQVNPTGTPSSNNASSNTPFVTIESGLNEVAFGIISGRAEQAYTTTNLGTELWSQAPYPDYLTAAAQVKIGAPIVDLTWAGTSDEYIAAGVSILPANINGSVSFTQTPAMCSPFTIAKDLIQVENYITVVNGTMPFSPDITAVLKYGGTEIIRLGNPIYESASSRLVWADTLNSELTIPEGEAVELEITSDESAVLFRILYDSEVAPSKIVFPTNTFIEVVNYEIYDAPYPGGSPITESIAGNIVYPRAVVSDPFGFYDITGLSMNILGSQVEAVAIDSMACEKVYEYEWITPSSAGDFTIGATAREGFEEAVTDTKYSTINLCTPPVVMPVFILGDSTARCVGLDSTTYIVTAVHATGIIYRLDTLSLSAGNRIDSITGEVAYVDGWIGETTITAIAEGCGGPVNANHIVLTNPSVTTPVFAIGNSSTRCEGIETIEYSAIASFATAITYTLDSTSLAAGNTIDNTTGEVNYIDSWNGNSTVTAVASGCNGPRFSDHIITTNVTVFEPTFDLGTNSTRCYELSQVYKATSGNATSITFSLDPASLAGGNTIDAVTGEVVFSSDWYNPIYVTASAEGCNGPKISTHVVNLSSNCAPFANDDYVNIFQGEATFINVLSNDSDINNDLDTASIIVTEQPTNGQVTILTDGEIIYRPNGNFTGQDTFVYQICDLTGNCDSAYVFITIEANLLDPCSEANKSHTFFLPFPEEELYSALRGATACPEELGSEVRTVISIKTPYPTIFIKYDHWEDGYEEDLTRPIQASTEIWGDGDLTNGVAPGSPTDILIAGASIVIDNTFDYTPPRDLSVLAYDGRDKLVSSSDVSISKISGDNNVFGFQSAKTSVSDVNRYGSSFTIPFGEDLGNEFDYTALFVTALEDSTSVTIDVNADGIIDENDVIGMLNQGEVLFVEGDPNSVNAINDVRSGATVTANNKLGLEVLFGGIDCFGTRNISLYPAAFYSNVYYSPVPTVRDNAPARVYFYNSYAEDITINWTSQFDAGTINVPAESTVDFLLPNLFTAYKFENLGGESFLAMEVIDSDNAGSSYDWAFSLIGLEQLSDFTSIAWAPGSSDFTRNDGPIWVTPTESTTLFIKNDGDVTADGPMVSECGRAYDFSVNIDELEVYQIRDNTDNDQSGTAIFTCDSTAFFGVFGEDPSTAISGFPSMDVGTNMQPMCSDRLILANEDVHTTLPEIPIDIPVIDNDGAFLVTLDPSSISTTGLLQPLNGTVEMDDDYSLIYTPNAGYEGTETFEYRLCALEDDNVCDIATVTVVVDDCSATPITVVINGFTYQEFYPDNGAHDGEATLPYVDVDLYWDANGNGIIDVPVDTFIISTTSNISGFYSFPKRELGNYIVKVNPNPSGYTPGMLNTGSAYFFAFGTCVNDLYLGVVANVEAINDTTFTELNTNLTINAFDNDIGNVELNSLSTNGLQQPLNGTVLINSDGTFSYEPDFEFIGIDSFQYQICSANDANICDIATVIVSVTCPAIPGQNTISGTVFFDTNENGVFENGESGHENAKVFIYEDWNQNGSVDSTDNLIDSLFTNNSGEYFFSPNISVFPTHYIITVDRTSIPGTYLLTDNIETAIFTGPSQADCVNNFGIQNCVNGCPPEANDDEADTVIGQKIDIDVLSNDFDSDGDIDPTSVTIPSGGLQPSNGLVTVDSVTGTITYLPNPLFSGVDSFEYQVCDLNTPTVYCDIALVTVSIFCPTIPGQNNISGYIFDDINGNGNFEQGEHGEENITVKLYEDINQDGLINFGDVLVDSVQSNDQGIYQFDAVSSSTTQTISVEIIAGLDDAEERKSSGQMLNNGDLDLGYAGTYSQWSGMRFQSITIPQGAIIENAYIEFTSNSNVSNASNLRIFAENVDDAENFEPTNFNITDRSRTGAIEWNNVSPWTTNTVYATPNISSIIQIITDRTNWTAGNDMVFMIDGSGRRSAYSFEGGPVPRLVVEYSVPNLPAYFVMSVDENTLPIGTILTTDNIEFAIFPSLGQDDCINNFGFQTCPGGCSPIANDDVATTQVGIGVEIDVLANDTDADLDIDTSLVSIPVTGIQPSNGTVSVNSTTGTITYFPNASFSGIDYFQYQICDQSTPIVKCDTAMVTVTVDCPVTPGENNIYGYVFDDDNGNGVFDSGDAGGENVKIRLYEDANTNGLLDETDVLVDSMYSNPDGYYTYSTSLFGSTQTIIRDVPNGVSDAEENLANGAVTTTASNDLEIVLDGTRIQLIGIRFSDLTIPPGATIENAYLEFYADGSYNGAANYTIYGEDVDNALEYTTANFNISNRLKTTEEVDWDNVQTWIDNNTYTTPDLSTIVQSIINRTNWESGNDMAFMIDGSGLRRAEAFESIEGFPPRLVIQYKENISGTYIMELDETTLPIGTEMTTDLIEQTTFNTIGESDCSNNFGYRSCPGGCAPIANDDNVTTQVAQEVSIDVLANDTDLNFDIDPSTVSIPPGGIQASFGTTSINTVNGEITYTPSPTFSGIDFFEYQVCDQSSPEIKCDTAMVTITVTCPTTPDGNTINGYVFEDVNANSVFDSSENGEENKKVLLYQDVNENGILDSIDILADSILSAADGAFSFAPNLITTQTITVDITSGSDDAEERKANGAMTLSASNDLELGNDNDNTQWIGLRFNNINIPSGATIQNAYIDFTAKDNNAGFIDLIIYGEDSDNAATFTSNPFNISSRPRTASVAWDNLPTWTNNVIYSTPSISSIVQSIIDRPNWIEGNDMAIIIEGMNGTARRRAWAIEGNVQPAKLIIEYEVSTFPGHFITALPPDELPIGTELTTPSTNHIIFNYLGESDCSKSFGYRTCPGGCAPIANDDTEITEENITAVIDVAFNDYDADLDLDLASVNIPTGVIQPESGSVSINAGTGEILYAPNNNFIGLDSFEYVICDLSVPTPKCDTALVKVEVVDCNIDTDQIKLIGQLFVDKNGNGINDDDGTGLQDIAVYLFSDNDCDGIINGTDEVLRATSTNLVGMYEFVDTVGLAGFPSCYITVVEETTLPQGYSLTTAPDNTASFSGPATCVKGLDVGAEVFITAVDDVELMLTFSGFIDVDILGNDLGNPTLPILLTQPTGGTALENGDGTIRFLPDDDAIVGSYDFSYQTCSSDDTTICDTALVTVNVTGCIAGPTEKIMRGKVFHDVNRNGLNELETGIESIGINFYDDVNQNGIVDVGDQFLTSETTDAFGNYTYAFVPVTTTVLDDFSTATYNGGSGPWLTDWIEVDPSGTPGPNGDYVDIISEELAFHWAFNNEELIQRSVDLSGTQTAILTFDWRTVGLDAGESLSIQLSSDGVNFTTLGNMTGNQSSSFTIDITSFISNNTTIRFLNENLNWEENEYTFIDNISIAAQYDVTHFVIETEITTYPVGYYLTTDNVETAIINIPGECDAPNDFGFSFLDNDQDGILDLLDLDDDNDGIPDSVESPFNPLADIDIDGVPAYLDDNDLAPLIGDINGLVESSFDFDGDNIPNHFDLDSDNDGCPDTYEAGHSQSIETNNTITGPYGLNGLSILVENNDTPIATINYSPAETATGVYDFLNFNIQSNCNTSPLAISDINATEIDIPVSGNLLTNDQDFEGDSLIINTAPMNVIGGTVIIEQTGHYTFTPITGFSGEASFDYEICDNAVPSYCDTAKVHIDVIDIMQPSNAMVVGMEDHFITENDNLLSADLLENDHDPAGDSLIINVMPHSLPENGSLTIYQNGIFNYSPNTNFTGVDQFTYEVCSAVMTSVCDTVIVTMDVLEGNGQNNLYATDDANLGNIGDTLTGNIILNDNDPSAGILTVNTNPLFAPQNGTVILDSIGNYSYIPDSEFAGNDRFVYQVCDSGSPAACDSATVYLTVLDNRVTLDLKVLLQGALFAAPDSLMRADLVSQGLVPLEQPYATSFSPLFSNRFVHTTGGNEMTTDSVLNANTGTPDGIVDWVFVELRDPTDSVTVIRTISALVQRDGDIVNAKNGGPLHVTNLFGQFFVLVKHRNHLGAMTAAPISVINKIAKADFTTMTDADLYHDGEYDGLEQTSLNDKKALWAGNANADNKVKYDGSFNDRIILTAEIITSPNNTDRVLNYNDAIGYFQGDINMDGKAKYDGFLNDRILLQYIILTYPNNSVLLNNYDKLIEQIK